MTKSSRPGLAVPIAALMLAMPFVAPIAPAAPARADILNDIFQVQCLPELDVIEVRSLSINGETAFKAIERPNQHLMQAYGIYAPKWYDDDLTWDEMMVTDLRERFECSLSTGPVELILLPEHLPRHSMGDFSISVTLIVAGRMLVDDVPFVLCENGGPITSLVYNATEGYIVLSGLFGGMHPRPIDPNLSGFMDDRRVFFIERDGIKAAEAHMVGWHMRHRPLQAIDIDYHGIDHDHGEGEELQGCRYHLVGPSLPESRKRWLNREY